MGNNVMRSPKKSEWGMALPMALIMLVLASIVVVPSVYAIGSLMTINRNVSQNTLAYYAADAGVAYLAWKYKTPATLTGVTSIPVGKINDMDVVVSRDSSGSNYWVSSATRVGTTSKAQIYVSVQQQGDNFFPYAAVALKGNITMNNNSKVVVVPDDIFIVDYCDTTWRRSFNTVTCTANSDAAFRETGVCYDLGRSAKMVVAANAAVGNLAYINMLPPAENIASYRYISAWIYSTIPLAYNDLQFKIAPNTGLGGTPAESIPIPAMPAGGTRVSLTITNPANFSSLDSIGIYLRVDKPLFTLYIDNVIATNHDVTADDRSEKGDMYANGNNGTNDGKITLNDLARVGGAAFSTKTVTVDPTAYVGIENELATALPDPVNVQTYIDQGDAGTDYTSQATSWSSSTGTGTVTIGPGYINGDVTLGGSRIFVLKGTIHVNHPSGSGSGKLTINNTVRVQGNYTIVSDGDMTISTRSATMLTADNTPFLICMGKVTMSNPRISAVIYSPNEAVNIDYNTIDTPPLNYNVYGSIIAKSVTLNNYATIRYMIRGGGTQTSIGYDYR